MSNEDRKQFELLYGVHKAICALTNTDPVDVSQIQKDAHYPNCEPPLPAEDDSPFDTDDIALFRFSDGYFIFNENDVELNPEEVVDAISGYLENFNGSLTEWVKALAMAKCTTAPTEEKREDDS